MLEEIREKYMLQDRVKLLGMLPHSEVRDVGTSVIQCIILERVVQSQYHTSIVLNSFTGACSRRYIPKHVYY